MSFVNPTYLLALLGLLIPIAIHLWSNKAGKTIKVGSIQLFQESESSKSSSIKLNEFLLLIIRSLLIGVVVFILAEPQLMNTSKNSPVTYLVESSLLENDKIKRMIDTMQTDDAVRLLLPNLPEIDNYDEVNFEATPNYWLLAQEMQKLETDSIVVFTSASKIGLKGKRPTINKPIEWIILNNEIENSKEHIFAFLKDSDVTVTSAKSNSEVLSFDTTTLSQNSDRISFNSTKDSISIDDNKIIALHNNQPQEVLIYYEDEFKDQVKFLESSINAIAKYTNNPISLNQSQTLGDDKTSHDLVIWLSNETAPERLKKIALYKPDDYANNIIEPGLSNNSYYLTKQLSTNSVINYRLPEQLLQLLYNYELNDTVLSRIDKRTVSKAELIPNFLESDVLLSHNRKNNLTKWLWLLLVPLLILERIIAKQRKQ